MRESPLKELSWQLKIHKEKIHKKSERQDEIVVWTKGDTRSSEVDLWIICIEAVGEFVSANEDYSEIEEGRGQET